MKPAQFGQFIPRMGISVLPAYKHIVSGLLTLIVVLHPTTKMVVRWSESHQVQVQVEGVLVRVRGSREVSSRAHGWMDTHRKGLCVPQLFRLPQLVPLLRQLRLHH